VRWCWFVLLLIGCGGSPTVPDARPIDATPLDAAAIGVPCGADMFCEPGATQGCCTDQGVSACEPTNGLCTGSLASCDGPEDCAPGDVCCDYGHGPGCGAAADCVPAQGGTPVCHGPC
jgi:hypothetical protein